MVTLRQQRGEEENTIFEPEVLNINIDQDKKRLERIIKSNPGIQSVDTIDQQISDLIKTRSPGRVIDPAYLDQERKKILNGTHTDNFGNWVYYPWSNRLVHVLGKPEFVELRTNRNLYKITKEEQDQLLTKKIAIIGLSVGQSIALALCMERICGTIILVDFDTVDLSNLNRIRTGIHNLGLYKTIIAAREIKEIDPYINVKIFNEGATSDNINTIIDINGTKVDIVVDECDNLEMKVKLREVAKANRLPIVMDTSDRGQIDIERFDLEPERPLFHGAFEGIDLSGLDFNSSQTQLQILNGLVDIENASPRALYSLGEIGKTLNTWPQLASSVLLGGAVGADICRRILLGESTSSGRFYVDLNKLVP